MRPAFASLILLASLPAAADEAPSDPVAPRDNFSHRLQAGVGVTVGSGYRVMFKYGDKNNSGQTTSCGQLDSEGRPATTCTGRISTWLDAKLFFGVSSSVDVVIEQRIGLESGMAGDFTAGRMFVLMPGIRVYPTDGTKSFKFFVQIQPVFDFTDPGASNLRGYDIGLHEANGFQWDFLKWMGAYLQISETFEFVRAFTFQLEGGGGIEGRFP